MRRAPVSRHSILNPQSSILSSLGVGLAPLLIASACTAARYSTEPGAPTLVLPAHFAEGKGEPRSASGTPLPSTAPRASTSAAGPPVTPVLTPSTAPDPSALRMAEQVEYELELNDGKVRVVSVKALKLPSPIVTPRRLGRYAIELRIGPELIERVRFDFPGTAADEPQVASKKALYAPLTLGERAIARVKLQLPQSPRVRQAVLVDRAANTASALDWPLPAVPKAPSARSGADSVKSPSARSGTDSVKSPSAAPAAQP